MLILSYACEDTKFSSLISKKTYSSFRSAALGYGSSRDTSKLHNIHNNLALQVIKLEFKIQLMVTVF